MSSSRLHWAAALALAAGATLLLAYRNALWCTSTGHTMRGDMIAERNVIAAQVGYRQQPSLWSTWLLPTYRHQLESSTHSFFDPMVYTHYPAFPELLQYGLTRLGVATLHGRRWVPIGLNVVALLALFTALKRLRDPLFGLLGMVAVMVQPLFWDGADLLHEHGFQLPQLALLLTGLAALRDGRKTLGVALAWLAAFWQGAYSFEHQLPTLGLIIGFWSASGRPRQDWPIYFVVATGGPIAFALHFLQNALYLGSLAAAFSDLAGAAARRSAGAPDDFALTWSGYLVWLAAAIRDHFGGAFALPLAGAFAIAWFADRPRRLPFKALAGATIGCAAWFILMRQIVWQQLPLMARMWMPLMAAAHAIAAYALIRAAQQWRAAPSRRNAATALLLAALTAIDGRAALLGMKRQVAKEITLARIRPSEQAGLTAGAWATHATSGLAGSALGLIHGAKPAGLRYRSVPCRADDAACAAPRQQIQVAFAEETTVASVAVKVDSRLPATAVDVEFVRLGEDPPHRSELLARAVGDGQGMYEALFPPARGRLFAVDLIAPPPRNYEVEFLILR
jgi:hypothetical protein